MLIKNHQNTVRQKSNSAKSKEMEKSRIELKSPAVDDLKIISDRHNLSVPDDDIRQYRDYLDKLLKTVYDKLNKMPDPVLSTRYVVKPGRAPTAAENPHNAWVRITDTMGSEKGRLMGRTVAIKDNISMSGVPMTVGSAFMKGYVSDHNAIVVERILDAGATIKGKATCEAMCISGNSFTSVTGPVLNPYDTSRSCGGSSSGCAALVASGAVDMALGTDQGGSLRIPASWTGCAALKPTYGLVPYTGILPIEGTLDCVGPMARTVKDCALLLETIAGSDGGLDPRQSLGFTTNGFSKSLTGRLDGLRVGLLKEGFSGCEADVADVVRLAAKNLTTLGAHVEDFSSTLHNLAMLVGIPIITEGMYSTYCNFGLNPLNTKGYKDVALNDYFVSAAKTKASDLPIGMKSIVLCDGYITERYGHHFYAKSMNCLKKIVEDYEEIFRQYDVIVMPTVKYKAPKLPTTKLSVKEFLEEHNRNTDNTFPYNATGHPAITVNAGYSEGLPVGMMIVGRHWQDSVVLKVAHAVEQPKKLLNEA